MRQISRLGVALLLAGLWLLSGCKSGPGIDRRPTPMVPPLQMGDPHAKAAPTELAPKEAAELCLTTAHKHYEKGQEAAAIIQYERARSLDPKIDVSRRLAVLYDRAGATSKAEVEYQKALAATPKDADLLNDYGVFHFYRGHLTEAERYYRAALEVNPKHERAWVNLGMVFAHQKRFDESRDAFAKVVPPAAAHANVARLLISWSNAEKSVTQSQQYRELARSELQKALELDPHLPSARVDLAFLDDPKSIYTAPGARQPKPNRFDRPKPASEDGRAKRHSPVVSPGTAGNQPAMLDPGSPAAVTIE